MVWQPVKEKENSELKPALFHLIIDHVLHPTSSREFGWIHTQMKNKIETF